MARMMGPVPSDKWEREVYQQLRLQLPHDWIAIAGVGWSRLGPSDDRRYVRDGQADFVVLAPGLGMVIVEVKGSRGFRIGEDGCWYAIGPSGLERELSESPPAQATRNMHELEDVVRANGTWTSFPGLFAYVVAYPQGKIAGTLPPLFDSSTLIVASQMQELERRLRHALLQRGSPKRGEQFNATVANEIGRLLSSQLLQIIKVDTTLDVADDITSIDVLTRQQFAALQGIFAHPRVAVIGPAGSGKTVLALWRLAALLETGKRALYVCFNKTLAESLQRRNPTMREQIKSVDSFFRGIAETGGVLPPQSEIQRDVGAFFHSRLPELILDLANGWSPEERYEALIVDEGQDFSDFQLLALLELLEQTEGTYAFFADWKQDVFRKSDSGAVGADVVFSLHHNCRNTSRTTARTNRLLGLHIPSMPGVPEGVEPVVLHSPDSNGMASHAWRLAKEWRAPSGRTAILSPWTLEKSAMANARVGHGMRLVTSLEEWEEPNTVYFSTIKSFKGIEATSVILVDLQIPDEDSAFRHEDLYVGCTRATARLGLITRHRDAALWIESH